MKNLIFTLFLLLFSIKTHAQCQTNNVLLTEYDEDVKDLALRRIFLFNHPDKSKVEIPQIWQDSIWEALAAIYNTQTIESDSVFDIYCIHHDSPNYTAINRSVSVTETWSFNPNTLALMTGNPVLDAFLSNHGVVFGYSTVFDGKILNLTKVINAQALVDSLVILGVTTAFLDGYIGDSNQIIYKKTGDQHFFDFSLRWGDCLAGCIQKVIWKFQVDNNCQVTYLGSDYAFDGGYPIPAPLNCHIPDAISTVEKINLKIFPNPMEDILKIETDGFLNEDAFLKIFDSQGCLVLYKGFSDLQNTNNQVFSFDIGLLKSGIYFLQVVDLKTSIVGKVHALTKF
jgi:Secretion system C-terminal sorting domain